MHAPRKASDAWLIFEIIKPTDHPPEPSGNEGPVLYRPGSGRAWFRRVV
jgi:hypothetical protein